MAPCLLPKISGVKVTPFVTSVESSEEFWCICEPRVCSACFLTFTCDQTSPPPLNFFFILQPKIVDD